MVRSQQTAVAIVLYSTKATVVDISFISVENWPPSPMVL
jgi:hypothetical protein